MLGELIRQERQRRNLSLRALAQDVGVSAAYLSDIERGNRHPTSGAMLERIGPALGIPSDVIWFTAGRIPPDIQAQGPARICRAFAAFRAALNGDTDRE